MEYNIALRTFQKKIYHFTYNCMNKSTPQYSQRYFKYLNFKTKHKQGDFFVVVTVTKYAKIHSIYREKTINVNNLRFWICITVIYYLNSK